LADQVREDALNRTLVALADPTRRAIVLRLAKGEARVTDLAAPFSVSLAAVSKHIRVLESAGIVRRTVVGREHVLWLEPEALAPAGEWISGLRAFWEQRLERLEGVLITQKRRPKPPARRRTQR
jgi:DNA-binding transcriptional ArsR family regulator